MRNSTEKRKRRGLLAATLLAAVAITIAAVPEARAQVGKLFDWFSYNVRTENQTATITLPDGSATKADDGGSISYSYTQARPSAEKDAIREQKYVRSLAEARALLPQGLALPPAIEGKELIVSRTMAKDGKVIAASLSEPNLGFVANYQADGRHEQIHATYGKEFAVTRQEQMLSGRPVLMVEATLPGGKSALDIWVEDGPWRYVLRGYGRDKEKMTEILETLQ